MERKKYSYGSMQIWASSKRHALFRFNVEINESCYQGQSTELRGPYKLTDIENVKLMIVHADGLHMHEDPNQPDD